MADITDCIECIASFPDGLSDAGVSEEKMGDCMWALLQPTH